MGADAELLHPTASRDEAAARPCHTRHEFDCGCFANDTRLAWMCERHRDETKERRRVAEEQRRKPMGADAEALNRTPAPALTEPEWRYNGAGAHEWRSPCERVKAMVWHNTHGKDWRYLVDLRGAPAQTTVLWAMSELHAKDSAIKDARDRLAELDAAPTPSKWHPIAASIATTVAEKNAAYGDSVTRSADIMRVLYPDGIPVSAYGDALLIVRVLDKLSRIATDRDALGESPWRDITGYALRACEGAGK